MWSRATLIWELQHACATILNLLPLLFPIFREFFLFSTTGVVSSRLSDPGLQPRPSVFPCFSDRGYAVLSLTPTGLPPPSVMKPISYSANCQSTFSSTVNPMNQCPSDSWINRFWSILASEGICRSWGIFISPGHFGILKRPDAYIIQFPENRKVRFATWNRMTKWVFGSPLNLFTILGTAIEVLEDLVKINNQGIL